MRNMNQPPELIADEYAAQLIAAYRINDLENDREWLYEDRVTFIVDELVKFCARTSGVAARHFNRLSPRPRRARADPERGRHARLGSRRRSETIAILLSLRETDLDTAHAFAVVTTPDVDERAACIPRDHEGVLRHVAS